VLAEEKLDEIGAVDALHSSQGLNFPSQVPGLLCFWKGTSVHACAGFSKMQDLYA
jgi:hypothetical protein